MRKKIYIIDDVPDILEALSVILTDAGYEVTTAEQYEGVNQILNTKPDLILLDLLLIGTSGTSICENIKKTRAGKQIPILMISAHPQAKLEKYTVQCGADGFIQKPFDLENLLHTVEKYLLA